MLQHCSYLARSQICSCIRGLCLLAAAVSGWAYNGLSDPRPSLCESPTRKHDTRLNPDGVSSFSQLHTHHVVLFFMSSAFLIVSNAERMSKLIIPKIPAAILEYYITPNVIIFITLDL